MAKQVFGGYSKLFRAFPIPGPRELEHQESARVRGQQPWRGAVRSREREMEKRQSPAAPPCPSCQRSRLQADPS